MIVNALVRRIRRRGRFHTCILIDRNGYHEVVVTKNELLTKLIKAMNGTAVGETLINVVLDDERCVSEVAFVPLLSSNDG